jgi:hypothetical protein
VEVSDVKVRAALDGVAYAEAALDEMRDRSNAVFPNFRDVRGLYTPGGGVGVFVSRGSAAFRQVALRPLPDD